MDPLAIFSVYKSIIKTPLFCHNVHEQPKLLPNYESIMDQLRKSHNRYGYSESRSEFRANHVHYVHYGRIMVVLCMNYVLFC